MTLQAKILIVLVSVILPIFVMMTVIENHVARPVLMDELKQFGVTAGKTLAAQIVSEDLFVRAGPLDSPAAVAKLSQTVDNLIREIIYLQPAIVRVDVARRDRATQRAVLVASNIEEDPTVFSLPVVDATQSELKSDEQGGSLWEVLVPIRVGKGRPMGVVRVLISTKLVGTMMSKFSRITLTAALVSVVLLVAGLSIALRKTVENDRLLRQAQNEKIQLSRELQDVQRQLLNSEKFSVMGQLTANFAHEIGTPLNAMGGHLQLLQEALDRSTEGGSRSWERTQIIAEQLSKIEHVVKSFLQTTAKPVSQKQLVDINQIIQKTVAIVRPRLDALGVTVEMDLDRQMGPLRMVPLDLEQVLLNLFNNSLDSLQAKQEKSAKGRFLLKIASLARHEKEGSWADLEVFDTGVGIKKENLANVWKPFFTTKRPGEGTGLGLNISERLISKNGGTVDMDSKEGVWAKVQIRLPYKVGEFA